MRSRKSEARNQNPSRDPLRPNSGAPESGKAAVARRNQAPSGATESSPGRKPGVCGGTKRQAPVGATEQQANRAFLSPLRDSDNPAPAVSQDSRPGLDSIAPPGLGGIATVADRSDSNNEQPKTTKTSVPPRLRARLRDPESEMPHSKFRIPLYPYQERWIKDRSRFKIAVKATQIGYSFAAALEAVLDCLVHRTLWIVLSRGERQSLEFMQKVQELTKALRIVGSKLETSFFDKADILQHEVKFPNGSRIIGLPANPDTARGYTGNMILDEFAFHQHDREIWAAAFGRVSRGNLKLRVLSTPNGCRGKYYEMAKEVGLTNREQGIGNREQSGSVLSVPCSRSPIPSSAFSGHWCDVHTAVAQGCPIDVAALRQAIGDEETWQQEYECVFLASSANYIPLEMILECQSPEATTVLPSEFGIRNSEIGNREQGVGNREQGIATAPRQTLSRAGGNREQQERKREEGTRNRKMEQNQEQDNSASYSLFPVPCSLFFGYDVGRVRDLAVLAVVEKVGDVFWTRALIEMPGATFAAQEQVLRDVIPHCVRGAVDSTGLGMEMAERLAAQFPGKVEPVTFTLARKQDLAIRMKRSFEERAIRIPDSRELRRDLNAVKRIVTEAGNIRFDAERDADHGHADRFWALALALHAADRRRIPVASGGIESERDWYEPSRPALRDEGAGPDALFSTDSLEARLLTRAARTDSTGEIAWA